MPTATLGAGAGITPVQNVYYTVLDTTKNARIYSIQTKQSNDELAVKTCYIRVTLDGVVTENGVGSANNAWWYYNYRSSANEFNSGIGGIKINYYLVSHAKSIKVECRTETAPSASTKLFCSVPYEVLTEVT